MALVTCPECGKDISDSAITCPNCGFDMEKKAICEECGKEKPESSIICPNCGFSKQTVTVNGEKKEGCLQSFIGFLGIGVFLYCVLS